ncbi:DegV family protein [Clostridium argentinense]|uniref:DegV family protein n=1 Tax=Clostridium argentinense TaxID=29341 RepID=UPI0009B74A30|nr:DegV family protein [Clostridium argentinense]ARC84734.1 fatty acid-binding protein DegV [Clostridium argentinense]NFF40248.1 DegV family protein [Clostridium argentinense]NFP51872.1 DegV family protein [Clostridium argentinense]NFP74471.1 DegV family protein [Clostridium argentinense]NFP77990.1 DegV family protein [Clostridium argentinense]
MEKIALITDSTSDLSKEMIDKYNIIVLPFRIIFKDREFRDGIEITPQEIYKSFEKEVPTSSLPSMKDMEEVFQRLEREGYTHAIAVTLSSKLSGIYNALKLVSEEYPSIKTHVFDSKLISYGESVIILEAAKMIEKGMSFDEVVRKLPEIKKRAHAFFVVGTLEYLKRGGRIGKVAGTIAELLNIKPIIHVDEEGSYATYDKVRGRKQSINRMIAIGNEMLDKKKCDIYVIHGEAEEEARRILEEISRHPNANSANFGGYISPVSGVHSGPGFLGVLFYEVE